MIAATKRKLGRPAKKWPGKLAAWEAAANHFESLQPLRPDRWIRQKEFERYSRQAIQLIGVDALIDEFVRFRSNMAQPDCTDAIARIREIAVEMETAEKGGSNA